MSVHEKETKCPKCGKTLVKTKEHSVRFDEYYVCKNSECYLLELAISFDDEHSRVRFG